MQLVKTEKEEGREKKANLLLAEKWSHTGVRRLCVCVRECMMDFSAKAQ